jgi:hypothetical protein
MGNPVKEREADAERRARAQARKPLIAKWEPNIPAGYIHVDDAIEYMRRRWSKMARAEMLEMFSRDDTGPKWTIFGDWPAKNHLGEENRGERYYAFDDIDLWVYRTMTGVPASWREALGRPSTVPVRRIELEDFSHAKESSNGRTRIEKDGRRRN